MAIFKQQKEVSHNVVLQLTHSGELSIAGSPLPVVSEEVLSIAGSPLPVISKDVLSLVTERLGRTPIPGEEIPMRYVLSIENPVLDLITGYLAWIGCGEGMALTLVICVFSSPDPFLNICIWISVSELCNGLIKWVMQHPRPFWLYSPIHTVSWALENQYSFPSGHSQGFMFFGTACYFNYGFNLWTTLILGITVLGGLSRIYLGVHFLHDVLVGGSIGATFGYLSKKIDLLTWFSELDLESKMIFSFAFMLIIPLTLLVIRHEFPEHPEEFIEAWTQNMRKNCKHEVEWRCREMHQYMQEYGFLMGVMWAMIINEKYDLQIGSIFLNETFESFENIWPRVLLGTSAIVMNIIAFEVLKKVEALRKVPLIRLLILYVLKVSVGFVPLLFVPWLAEKHGWLN